MRGQVELDRKSSPWSELMFPGRRLATAARSATWNSEPRRITSLLSDLDGLEFLVHLLYQRLGQGRVMQAVGVLLTIMRGPFQEIDEHLTLIGGLLDVSDRPNRAANWIRLLSRRVRQVHA